MATKLTVVSLIMILLVALGRLVWRLYDTEAELIHTRAQLTKARATASVVGAGANGNGTADGHYGANPNLPLREVYTGFDQDMPDKN